MSYDLALLAALGRALFWGAIACSVAIPIWRCASVLAEIRDLIRRMAPALLALLALSSCVGPRLEPSVPQPRRRQKARPCALSEPVRVQLPTYSIRPGAVGFVLPGGQPRRAPRILRKGN